MEDRINFHIFFHSSSFAPYAGVYTYRLVTAPIIVPAANIRSGRQRDEVIYKCV